MNTTQLNVILATLLCAGCANPVIKSEPAASNLSGLVYALPKGQVQLEVIRKIVTEGDVKAAAKDVDSAKAALDTSDGRLKEAKAARDAAQHEVDALTKDDKASEKEKFESKLAQATVMLRARTVEAAVAKTQYAEAVKRSDQAKSNVNKMEQKVSLKALPVIPDATRRYVAQLQSSLFRDDSIKLSISNGLLNTSTSESTGQVGNVLVSLVSAASGFRSGGGIPMKTYSHSVSGPKAPGEDKTCKPFAHTWIFDPTDQDEINAVTNDIKKKKTSLIALKMPTPESQAATNEKISVDGLAYRVPVTVTIGVELNNDSGTCEVSSTDSYVSFTTTVPDSKTTYFASVNGANFTKTKAEYAFKDGMPISFSTDQPSQAAAVARIPVEILKAIIEVPTSILKLRVDYDSQAEALIKERTDQLKAQVDLINAQKTLDEAGKE